ncbi:MAG: WG repeat-containing protein [Acidobacteriota bacterium]|nr:WG repeat-containing protein [Acidobacteriota bacterium]
MTVRLAAALLLVTGPSWLVPSGRASDVVVRQHRDADTKGPLPVFRSGKWGYIAPSGAIAIAPQFEEAGFFYEDRAAVRVNGRWGYIDTSGRLMVPPHFSAAARFSDGVAHVRWSVGGDERSAAGYVDVTGQIVLRCEPGSPDVHLTAARCGRQFLGGYVAEAVEVFRCVDEFGNPKEYPCRATLIDRWGYYDKSGRLAIPGPFHSGASRFSDGLAGVQRYGEKGVGFIDESGEFAIAPTYDQVAAFSEGLAAVRLGGTWGFIDRRGQPVVERRFQSVSDFSNGYATARLDGAWGYLDRTGRFAISPRFQEAAPFSEGLAAVCCDGDSTRYIDAAGRWAFETVLPRGIANGGRFVEGVALVELRGVGGAYIDRVGRVVAPLRSPD